VLLPSIELWSSSSSSLSLAFVTYTFIARLLYDLAAGNPLNKGIAVYVLFCIRAVFLTGHWQLRSALK
jgi:hypothetical protein